MKINGSSTTSLQIRSRPDTNTKRTEKGRLKIQRSEGSYIHEIKGDSTLKNDTLKYIWKNKKKKEILSTNVLNLCRVWVDEWPDLKKM